MGDMAAVVRGAWRDIWRDIWRVTWQRSGAASGAASERLRNRLRNASGTAFRTGSGTARRTAFQLCPQNRLQSKRAEGTRDAAARALPKRNGMVARVTGTHLKGSRSPSAPAPEVPPEAQSGTAFRTGSGTARSSAFRTGSGTARSSAFRTGPQWHRQNRPQFRLQRHRQMTPWRAPKCRARCRLGVARADMFGASDSASFHRPRTTQPPDCRTPVRPADQRFMPKNTAGTGAQWSSEWRRPPAATGGRAELRDPSEVTLSKVHRQASETEDQDLTSYALGGWGRTARLCAIRLTEAIPALTTVILLCIRH